MEFLGFQRERCPNGTRRNNKTGNCHTIKNKKYSKKKYYKNRSKKKKYYSSTTNKSRKKNKYILLSTNIKKLVHEQGERSSYKSFSPSINKLIESLKTTSNKNIMNCNIEDLISLYSTKSYNNNNQQLPEPEIEYYNKGKLICLKTSHPKAQKLLINNLKSSKNLNYDNIIMPIQKQSNCWFNTMFANFFISDKGRKFFRFLRQLMIEGKKIIQYNNRYIKQTIEPKNLRYAFILFNACIEACYNMTDDNRDIALALDTNNIISAIYNSIPKSKRKKYTNITDIGLANNPIDYYNDIIKYLGAKSINILELKVNYPYNRSYSSILGINNVPNNYIYKQYNKLPDVIILEIFDNESKKEKKELSFTIKGKGKVKTKYILDSVIIRDTTKSHFCSLIMCNGIEKGYDGASFSRLNNFNWKKYINTNKEWSFNGSNFMNSDGSLTNKSIYWNFNDGYHMLFYYRV